MFLRINGISMSGYDFYYKSVWKDVLNKVFESGQINENITPYFDSRLDKIENNLAFVVAKNFISMSIMSQNVELIENCFEMVTGEHVKVKVFYEDDYKNGEPGIDDGVKPVISRDLDPNQTFTNFVTGKSNVQAHIASLTCASNVGLVYNPLFIYGNPGLGKTHLLNAIGNSVKEKFPTKTIAYISGLEFVDGVFKASQEYKLDEFKNSFKQIDLLLVDDIQFIAGKDKTHEIFFSVFNELVNNRKQVCITADRIPSEIKGLEDRIISRFNQGLVVNIEAPEYETSINILKMKIANNIGISQTVDDEVLNYLATNFSTDVRSLEGAVNRLLFYSINFPLPEDPERITLKLCVEAFKDQVKESKKELTISSVRKAVCDYYNLTKQQIISASRTKNIANARHIAIYLCRKLIDAPYQEIGNEFGKRDHSTIMSACEKVEKLIKTDPLYLRAIQEIEEKLK